MYPQRGTRKNEKGCAFSYPKSFKSRLVFQVGTSNTRVFYANFLEGRIFPIALDQINMDLFNHLRGDAVSLTFNNLVIGANGDVFPNVLREIGVYTR